MTTFAVLDLVQMNDGQYAELLHGFARVGSRGKNERGLERVAAGDKTWKKGKTGATRGKRF